MKQVIRSSLLLLAAVCAVPACDRRAPDEMPSNSGVAPPEMSMDAGLAAFLHGGPVDIGSSRSSVVARLGEPDSVVTRTTANRHDPAVTDSVFELHYDGITAEVYRAAYDGKEMLTGLEIRDAQYMTPTAKVRPGTPVSELVAEYGEPTDSSADRLRYVCDECLVSGHETVEFTVAGGVVRGIRIQYWID